MKKEFGTLSSVGIFLGVAAGFIAKKALDASFLESIAIAGPVSLIAYAVTGYAMTGKFFPSPDDFDKDTKEPAQQRVKHIATEKNIEPTSEPDIQQNNRSETHFRDMVSEQKGNINKYR